MFGDSSSTKYEEMRRGLNHYLGAKKDERATLNATTETEEGANNRKLGNLTAQEGRKNRWKGKKK